MIAVILQPGYLSWLGFFEQMWKSDIFVIYDDVQYTVRDWRNRNKIKTNGGIKYLTVPVGKISREMRINQVRIKYDNNWQLAHLNTIKENYFKAPFFNQYFFALKEIISKRFEYLIDLDAALIKEINKMLGLEKKLVYSSELNITDDGRCKRMIKICQYLKTDILYEGSAGKNYMDVDSFKKEGISVEFQEYKHPSYHQLYGDFVPYLSIIDLLFNEGPNSLKILADLN